MKGMALIRLWAGPQSDERTGQLIEVTQFTSIPPQYGVSVAGSDYMTVRCHLSCLLWCGAVWEAVLCPNGSTSHVTSTQLRSHGQRRKGAACQDSCKVTRDGKTESSDKYGHQVTEMSSQSFFENMVSKLESWADFGTIKANYESPNFLMTFKYFLSVGYFVHAKGT